VSKLNIIEDFFPLPLVSTTPVVYFELQISSQIFEKNRNSLLWDTQGLGGN
jgi:hypothetical protein